MRSCSLMDAMRFPFLCLLGCSALVWAQTPCADLTKVGKDKWPNPATIIASATANPASEAKAAPPGAPPFAAAPALPAHCEVVGRLNDREGMNGQHYAIKFH